MRAKRKIGETGNGAGSGWLVGARLAETLAGIPQLYEIGPEAPAIVNRWCRSEPAQRDNFPICCSKWKLKDVGWSLWEKISLNLRN